MVTLIKNVVIVDGTGKPPFKGDIVVRDGKIMARGSFPSYNADVTIQGNGAYATPGFIDPDITSDRYLTIFEQPQHTNFLSQGITSGIIGQCGFSLAPNFYGSLHNFVRWTTTNAVNINWKGVGEFLDALGHLHLGINIGTLVGHKVVREDIVHRPDEDFRNLTANELRVFRMVLERALREGALGFSAGLGYPPYQQTTYHELRALVDVVKKQGGVYTTHLRDEKDNLVSSVEETVRLAQEMSVPVIINHLRPFKGFEKEYEQALSYIQELAPKAMVYFDGNPFTESAAPVESFLPPSLRHKDRDSVLAMMEDDNARKEIISQLPSIQGKKMLILYAPEMEFLNGVSLYQFAQNRGLSYPNALVELMRTTKLRGVVLYENLSKKAVTEGVLHSHALVSTNSPSISTDKEKGYVPERMMNTFPSYIALADKKGLPIEKTISKITGLIAKLYNIQDRGFLVEGYAADITLIGADQKITHVFVNGELSYQQGNKVSARSGQVIRASHES